ncbi:PaaI family thioesterase [Catellatospora vulcania]|uniref:PaaI family thioesterase n=1 Tax=Catellatospora vulcania TaxID=1460450 RepID=UPI0012D4767C|nr:PaaI family thioesterase [Catellatospora vulcania]
MSITDDPSYGSATPPVPHPEAPAPGTVLPSHFLRCYGCGPEHPAGLHMAVTVGDGASVHARLQVTEQHQGAAGIAHGGLLSCALDEALGSAALLLGRPAVTARLETDFCAPVTVGSELHIHARCTGVAGRKVYLAAEARVGGAEGPVAVRATALFLTVDLTHFAVHGDTTQHRSDPGFAAVRRTFGVA